MAFRVRRSVSRTTEDELLTTVFLITVSTNKDLGELTDKAKVWLDRKLGAELTNFTSHLNVYRVAEDNKMILQRTTPEIIERMISDTDAEVEIEVGGKRHRLHAHAVIRFKHSPRYRFKTNIPSFREKFPGGFHINIRYIKDHNFDLLRYIRKQQE